MCLADTALFLSHSGYIVTSLHGLRGSFPADRLSHVLVLSMRHLLPAIHWCRWLNFHCCGRLCQYCTRFFGFRLHFARFCFKVLSVCLLFVFNSKTFVLSSTVCYGIMVRSMNSMRSLSMIMVFLPFVSPSFLCMGAISGVVSVSIITLQRIFSYITIVQLSYCLSLSLSLSQSLPL